MKIKFKKFIYKQIIGGVIASYLIFKVSTVSADTIVNDCQILDQEGERYIIEGDFSTVDTTCFTVGADNITIVGTATGSVPIITGTNGGTFVSVDYDPLTGGAFGTTTIENLVVNGFDDLITANGYPNAGGGNGGRVNILDVNSSGNVAASGAGGYYAGYGSYGGAGGFVTVNNSTTGNIYVTSGTGYGSGNGTGGSITVSNSTTGNIDLNSVYNNGSIILDSSTAGNISTSGEGGSITVDSSTVENVTAGGNYDSSGGDVIVNLSTTGQVISMGGSINISNSTVQSVTSTNSNNYYGSGGNITIASSTAGIINSSGLFNGTGGTITINSSTVGNVVSSSDRNRNIPGEIVISSSTAGSITAGSSGYDVNGAPVTIISSTVGDISTNGSTSGYENYGGDVEISLSTTGNINSSSLGASAGNITIATSTVGDINSSSSYGGYYRDGGNGGDVNIISSIIGGEINTSGSNGGYRYSGDTNGGDGGSVYILGNNITVKEINTSGGSTGGGYYNNGTNGTDGTVTINGSILVSGDTELDVDGTGWLGAHTWTFTNTAKNLGNIKNNAEFRDSSENAGDVDGICNFYDDSVNNGTCNSVIFHQGFFFSNINSDDWEDPSNWFTDPGLTNPLGYAPTSTSETVTLAGTTTGPVSTTTVGSVKVASSNVGGGFFGVDLSKVFGTTPSNFAVSFFDRAFNTGIINGTMRLFSSILGGFSQINKGTVLGDVEFYNDTYNDTDNVNNQTFTGIAKFFNSSYNDTTGFLDTAVFNDTSKNKGNVLNAVFNGDARNLGTTTLTAIFNDSSSNAIKFPFIDKTDLIAYYTLDETSGNFDDHSDNDYQATPLGTILRGVPGVVGNSIEMTGVANSYLSLGLNTYPSLNDSITVSAWIKPKQLVGGTWAQIKFGNNNRALLISFDPVNKDVNAGFRGVSNGVSSYQNSVTLNNWVHVVYTYNGQGLTTPANYKFYINGVEQTEWDGWAHGGVTDISTIGYDENHYLFRGNIDEFGIWSRVLTPDEVGDLYNGGNSLSIQNSVIEEFGVIEGDATFYDNSFNKSIVNGTSTFKDNSYNIGTTTNAIFIGDFAENFYGSVQGVVTGIKTRMYTETANQVKLLRDFASSAWTVVADNTIVKLLFRNLIDIFNPSSPTKTTLIEQNNGVILTPFETSIGTSTPITKCGVLDDEGTTYVLQNNITNFKFDSCFIVLADNITLDGNGKTLDGLSKNVAKFAIITASTTATTTGASAYNNLTVKNLTVTDFDIAIDARGRNNSSGKGGKAGNVNLDGVIMSTDILARGGNGTIGGGNGGEVSLNNSSLVGTNASTTISVDGGDSLICGNGGNAGFVDSVNSIFDLVSANPGSAQNSGCIVSPNKQTGSSGGTRTNTGTYTPPGQQNNTPPTPPPTPSTPSNNGGSPSNRNAFENLKPGETTVIPNFNFFGPGGIGTFNPTNVGVTVVPWPFKDFKPVTQLVFTPTINFDLNISRFLFAPLPSSIADAISRMPQIASALSSSNINKEQDLAALSFRPIPLQNEENPDRGQFIVKSGDTQIQSYVAYDLSMKTIAQLVKVSASQSLSISLIPLSEGGVTATYLDQVLTFTNQAGDTYTANITTPFSPGRYVLKTDASPIPLIIEVVSQSEINELNKDTSKSWLQKIFDLIFGWFN